ncbi:hypothetical protein CCP2SC5_880012 [Azospirillaceae bacterium]
MNAVERTDISEFYGNRVIDLMEGRRNMPEVSYPARKAGEWHLSDIDGSVCLGVPLCRARFPQIPPIRIKSALHFLKGRVVERAITDGKSIEPKFMDGLWSSGDDLSPFGYAEIKATTADMDKFRPLAKYPWWINRIMGYCRAYDVESWNLVVVFIVGNLWTNKKNPTTIGIRAWELAFDHDEIMLNWGRMLGRKEMLESWIADGTWPRAKEAGAYWSGSTGKVRCDDCQMKPLCPIFQTIIMDDDGKALDI